MFQLRPWFSSSHLCYYGSAVILLCHGSAEFSVLRITCEFTVPWPAFDFTLYPGLSVSLLCHGSGVIYYYDSVVILPCNDWVMKIILIHAIVHLLCPGSLVNLFREQLVNIVFIVWWFSGKSTCSQQCRSQEQTHMPRRVWWLIFNLRKKKIGPSHSVIYTIIQLL
jgi:hypothetical protein